MTKSVYFISAEGLFAEFFQKPSFFFIIQIQPLLSYTSEFSAILGGLSEYKVVADLLYWFCYYEPKLYGERNDLPFGARAYYLRWVFCAP